MNALFAVSLFPYAINQILWLGILEKTLEKEYILPPAYKIQFSYFGNIAVVTSRNSKYLRKFALLFNTENFDRWDNFLVIHPSESNWYLSSLHQGKLQ